MVQNPQAAPSTGLRLDDLATLSWPAAVCGERIGGGPVPNVRLTERERLAGLSAPRDVTTQIVSDLTPRLDRVTSGVVTCADRLETRSTALGGSVFMIDSGSHLQIGLTVSQQCGFVGEDAGETAETEL